MLQPELLAALIGLHLSYSGLFLDVHLLNLIIKIEFLKILSDHDHTSQQHTSNLQKKTNASYFRKSANDFQLLSITAMKQEVSGTLTAPSLPAWLPMKPQSASIIILAANRELVPVGAKGTNARVSRICRDPSFFLWNPCGFFICSSRARENKRYF